MDWIELDRFVVPCVIGILDSEQQATQPLEVEVGLGLDLEAAGDTGDLSASVNYADVCDEVRFLARAGHWRLLETLALAVLRHLLAPSGPGEGRAALQGVRLALKKPEILGGRAVPGIRMARDAEWREVTTLLAEGIEAEVLVRVDDVGAYRATLAQGASWRVASPVALRVVSGTVRIGDATHRAGAEVTWDDEPLVAQTPAVTLLVARPPMGVRH